MSEVWSWFVQDDLTMTMKDVIILNNQIKAHLDGGYQFSVPFVTPLAFFALRTQR